MVPAVQGSLLEIFEQQFAETIGTLGTARPARVEQRSVEPNPFKKREGVCAHCADEKVQRIYWCHVCKQTGCYEWLKDHKDS